MKLKILGLSLAIMSIVCLGYALQPSKVTESDVNMNESINATEIIINESLWFTGDTSITGDFKVVISAEINITIEDDGKVNLLCEEGQPKRIKCDCYDWGCLAVCYECVEALE